MFVNVSVIVPTLLHDEYHDVWSKIFNMYYVDRATTETSLLLMK